MNNQLATTNTDSQLSALAGRIKLMISNGKNLTDQEALALAQYSIATDLNPFAGECYYLPGIGPGPGIAGWRKKADEQLEYEARRAAEPLARFWCDYIDADANEAGTLNAGDIAVKAILHDTLTKTAWERRRLGHVIDLIKAGMKISEALPVAEQLSGDEPTWSAIGLVRGGENFGGDKMPRYERACKRAEKAAIRKRFPRVHLPEPSGFDEAEVIDATASETNPTINITTGEIINASATYNPADITVDLAHLSGFITKSGKALLMMTDEELTKSKTEIDDMLIKNNLTAEQKAELNKWLKAIDEIQTWRRSHPGA